jgi:hypothetical protein
VYVYARVVILGHSSCQVDDILTNMVKHIYSCTVREVASK